MKGLFTKSLLREICAMDQLRYQECLRRSLSRFVRGSGALHRKDQHLRERQSAGWSMRVFFTVGSRARHPDKPNVLCLEKNGSFGAISELLKFEVTALLEENIRALFLSQTRWKTKHNRHLVRSLRTAGGGHC